jgi:hypothetical protein
MFFWGLLVVLLVCCCPADSCIVGPAKNKEEVCLYWLLVGSSKSRGVVGDLVRLVVRFKSTVARQKKIFTVVEANPFATENARFLVSSRCAVLFVWAVRLAA